MDSQKLSDDILRLMEREDFYSFDIFLIEKILGADIRAKLSDKSHANRLRWEGYRELMRRLGDVHVAAAQTIQKWFGIHGKSTPGREHIFRLGFALGLKEEEVSEYLRRGIREPDFRMNDYREVIFCYSYWHRMSYGDALGMIEEFEGRMSPDTVIWHYNDTNSLEERLRINCNLDKAEFLGWMLQYAGEFKGYSMTALKYFQSYKREILREVKADAQKQLNELLKQTAFYAWAGNRKFSFQKKAKLISKYFATASKRKEAAISEELKAEILELLEMSKISEDSNSELLAELYADINHKYCNHHTGSRSGNKEQMPVDVNLMNDKYLSQLLKTGNHKEMSLRLTMLYSRLKSLPEGSECPQEVWQVLREYGYEGDSMVGDAMLGWLAEKRRQKERECHIISREDLLPLILCVAQKRYLKSTDHYQEEEAKRVFVHLANMTLSACHMEIFRPEEYEFDALLSLCYGPSEMHFLSDVLEVLAGCHK